MPRYGPLTEKTLRKRWRPKGFTTNRWADPPGKKWPIHRHAVDEAVLVVSGDVSIQVAGHTVKPRPGEVVEIPAGQPHSIHTSGKSHSEYFFGFKRLRR